MWRTSAGDRTLKGIEAEVYLTALREFASELREERDEHESAVRVFNRLSFGQRVGLLEDVTAALLDDGIPTPEHTAANEAAIYAVYRHLHSLVLDELMASQDGKETFLEFRTLLHKAGTELGIEEMPDPDCADEQEWDNVVEELSDRVLWDRDFEDEDSFVDAVRDVGLTAPEHTDSGEPWLPYFGSIPRDPTDAEVVRILAGLIKR
jgi:hypothetical protein